MLSTADIFIYVVAPIVVAVATMLVKAIFMGVNGFNASLREVNTNLTRMAAAQENTNEEVRDIKEEVKQVNRTAQITAEVVARHQDRLELHGEAIKETKTTLNDLRERIAKVEGSHH